MPPRYKRQRSIASVAARGTRLDIDVLVHMRLVEKVGDTFHIMGSRKVRPQGEETEEGDDTNMEEDIPHSFPGFGTFSSAGTSGAGPSFQGASDLSNEEVLARMMSRIDMFDARFHGMETMISDRFQSIEIMQGSLDSRIDTMQSQYQGIASQLQIVIQLLQSDPPPPLEE
ncbi:hypothetical protein JCGZ_08914 [Jatropha curcas]|uniref:Uncharacterized protein n=1 Tax=Jatropha curcas TaxID=180498 RepID=A0A067LEM5_JATCU|nr:hypothetical protein JCGZ_08914 [Jatropha curcas]